MTGSDPSYDPAAASHRALREIRRELERHPAVEVAKGFPPDTHSTVEATLDPSQLATTAGEASLTVRWFAGEAPDDPPRFSFHYSDDTGLDCGWHHEPNPHVDGWGHYQERPDPETAYNYEPYSVGSQLPARVVWEGLSRLAAVLEGR